MSSASAEINLNVLTACGDIAALSQSLRSEQMPTASDCRTPNGALERSLLERVGGQRAGLCFLRSAPAPLLEGYSCIRAPTKVGASLDCFRSVRATDISAFKENEDRGSGRANEYKISASKCEVTNGNSTVAPPTTFSPLLAHVARQELGFVSPIGRGRKTNSYVQHGFASTDPSIKGEARSAIEYVSFLIAGEFFASREEQRTVGDWVVRIDADKEADENLNELYRKNRIPFYVTGRHYVVEGPAASSTARRSAFTESLKRAIAKRLIADGFTDLPRESREKLTNSLLKSIPFGRRQYTPTDGVGKLRLLINTTRPVCTEDDGAVVVVLMPIIPAQDVDSDFGGMFLLTVGMGSCSRISQSSTRSYLNGLNKIVDEQLIAEFNRR